MIIWGENVLAASPKEQVMKIMNLSGKRTRIGRNSGERFRLSYVKPPKRKAIFGKLSGPRTENPCFSKGVFLSFFVWKCEGGDYFGRTVETNTFI